MTKIALVHDYLTQRGGAERVFELLCNFFPDADVFTSVFDAKNTIQLGDRPVNTTYLQQIPGAAKYFRLLAPFYFSAFRALDLQEYDLILSSSTSFAKAVRKRSDAVHICFCHNITRFLWETDTYLRHYGTYRPLKPLIEPIFQAMRDADLSYSQEPDLYIANSTTVAERIQRIYGRPAITINYPIDSRQFIFSDQKDDYYLSSARLLSYKRIDLIVEAFNWLGYPLLISGSGPERQRLESRALGNIKFLGHVSDSERRSLFTNARSVIVAACEDYGLVPVEANFSGTPVIAYGAGGVLDTQIPGETGVLFKRQTPESLIEALLKANQVQWNYQAIRDHALNNFTEDVFYAKIRDVIDRVCHQKATGQLLSQSQNQSSVV